MSQNQSPSPGLSHAFDLVVQRAAPIDVGALAIGGRRVHVPVTGGSLVGEGLSCRVTGGSETQFRRTDGITVLEAVYMIDIEGQAVRAQGQGYRTDGGDFSGTRMAIYFEAAADGPLAHLSAAAFLAEELPETGLLSIHRIV